MQTALLTKPAFAGVRVASRTASVRPRGAVRVFAAANRPVWLPGIDVPSHLKGEMPGDSGFDPVRLILRSTVLITSGAPGYTPVTRLCRLQLMSHHSWAWAPRTQIASSGASCADSIAQHASIARRYQEAEKTNGRWAMAAVVGILVTELLGKPKWFEAGAEEYWMPSGPLLAIEFLIMGFFELKRYNGWVETKTVRDALWSETNDDTPLPTVWVCQLVPL